MAIQEFGTNGPFRAKVAFFDSLPAEADLARFKERKFECVDCTEHQLQNLKFVAHLDAVIFSQQPKRRQAIGDVLKARVPLLLNCGVRVYVRIAEDSGDYSRKVIFQALLEASVPIAKPRPQEMEQIPKSLRERESSMLAPSVHLFDSGMEWVDIAHIVCDQPAGMPPNRDLKPDGDLSSLKTEEEREEGLLLLQRAFEDCKTLHLRPMAEGLSGAPVFKAYAALDQPVAGDWPYLHFVPLPKNEWVMRVSGDRHAPRSDEERVRGGRRPAKRTLDAAGPAIRWRIAEAGVVSASAMQPVA